MTLELRTLEALGLLAPLDVAFAAAMGRIGGEASPPALLGAALATRASREGHVCVEISRLAGTPVITAEGEAAPAARWPEAAEWLATLNRSPLVSADAAPLVLDGAGRLYLRKYWQYQEQLASALVRRAGETATGVDPGILEACLARHSGPAVIDGEVNQQRLAAERAVRGLFTVITGGPGTGKTTTAIQILLVIADTAIRAGQPPPRIAALAPTGKAAARLEEVLLGSIRGKEATLGPEVIGALPKAAGTIHRALGPLSRSGLYRRSGPGTLRAEVVLIDEASMVDLALMHRLVRVLKPRARLIVIGDRDQLASVESGAVLADICDAASAGEGPLTPRVIELTRGHRFGAASPIHTLARAINRGAPEAVVAQLADAGTPEVALVPLEERSAAFERLEALIDTHLVPVYAGATPEEKLAAFGRFRLLSAHRRGSLGQEGLNRFVEERLRRRGIIAGQGPWFDGRPVLVTRNDYMTGLFNGDVGIALPDPEGTGLAVHFQTPGGGTRRVAAARMPHVDTVFCMTVHKSQGSEFDHVALFLPETRSPIVTRELLYTACTRAKEGVTVFGTRKVIQEAVETRIHRASGLRDSLL